METFIIYINIIYITFVYIYKFYVIKFVKYTFKQLWILIYSLYFYTTIKIFSVKWQKKFKIK